MKNDRRRNIEFGRNGVLMLVFAFVLVLADGICRGQEIMTSPIYGVRQGEVLVLTMSPQQCTKPLSIFRRAYSCDTSGRLVIGADFQEKPGTYRLEGTSAYVDVLPGQFPEPVYRRRGRARKKSEAQRLKDEAAREKERQLQREAFNAGPALYPELVATEQFRLPLKSIHVTDPFALERRYWRGKKSDYVVAWHRGLDLRARPVGRPVYAVNSGCVIQTYHYKKGGEGKMLTLYHGSNIYSLYLHLNGFEVKEGDCVKKGQLIARSGKTGTRSPHLHLAMKVNTKTVNPLKFIEQFNESLGDR